jgi:hypothetical protein
MNRLDPRVRKVWAIKLAVAGAVVLLAAIVHDVANLFDAERWMPLGVVPGVVLVVFSATVLWVPRLRYRFWWFALTEQELVLERGILNRVRTIVPLRRVQHLDVSQDIVEREFDLGKLVVHTAGTRSSEVVVPGLRLEEAERLRDRIKAYIVDDAL